MLMHASQHIILFVTAEKNFVKLEKAKSVLLDEELRKKYDQWRSSKLHISFEQWLSMSSMMHSVSVLHSSSPFMWCMPL